MEAYLPVTRAGVEFNKAGELLQNQVGVTTQNGAAVQRQRLVLSLFTGAGGLDLGLEAAGFSVAICVEIDDDARETLRENRPDWKLASPGDIHKVKPEEILAQAQVQKGDIDLMAGGPPCQPFSKSAFWSNGGTDGSQDPRADCIFSYFDVVEAALPRVFLLENVRGFASLGEREDTLDPLRERLDAINRRWGTRYQLQVLHINSASYGVPQIRERVFVLASIDGRFMELPSPTHGSGEGLEPFRTAWDALGDLDTMDWSPELAPTGKWADLLSSIPEGSNYLWHTARGGGEPLFGWRTRFWSFLLKLSKCKPSWTIQAEPGPATGPFHWANRNLSIEELARLQTFPDEFRFVGNRRSVHRQIGNAVPCAIGELLGLEIRRQLLGDYLLRGRLRLVPEMRDDCPPAHPTQPVSHAYLHLLGEHPDHPGAGLGPGRIWRE